MIPLDLEDIFGSAVAEAVKRGIVFFVCLLLASVLAAFSMGAGEAVLALNPRRFGDSMEWWLFAWIVPLPGLWAILYVPVLLTAAYRFFTAETIFPDVFIRFLAAESVLILLAMPDWKWERGVALIVLGGSLMAIRHLARIVAVRLRSRFEGQLIGIAAQNRETRARLREQFGTEIPEPENPEDREPR